MYEEVPGWKGSAAGARRIRQTCPKEAREYVAHIERACRLPDHDGVGRQGATSHNHGVGPMIDGPRTESGMTTGSNLPRHIAIIMDGNGRWARARELPRIRGHEAGVESIRDIVTECARIEGIDYLTLYAFSRENWKRPKAEVDFLMHLLKHFCRQELATMMENSVRFATIGSDGRLPADVRRKLKETAQQDGGQHAPDADAGAQLRRAGRDSPGGAGGRRGRRPRGGSRRGRSPSSGFRATSTRRSTRTRTSSSARPARCG